MRAGGRVSVSGFRETHTGLNFSRSFSDAAAVFVSFFLQQCPWCNDVFFKKKCIHVTLMEGVSGVRGDVGTGSFFL